MRSFDQARYRNLVATPVERGSAARFEIDTCAAILLNIWARAVEWSKWTLAEMENDRFNTDEIQKTPAICDLENPKPNITKILVAKETKFTLNANAQRLMWTCS